MRIDLKKIKENHYVGYFNSVPLVISTYVSHYHRYPEVILEKVHRYVGEAGKSLATVIEEGYVDLDKGDIKYINKHIEEESVIRYLQRTNKLIEELKELR